MAVLFTDLATFTGQQADSERGMAVINVVTALVKSYTRGQGFSLDGPNEDINAVILSASARLLRNTSGVVQESMGPFSAQFDGDFSFTVAEKFALDRYRVRAQ